MKNKEAVFFIDVPVDQNEVCEILKSKNSCFYSNSNDLSTIYKDISTITLKGDDYKKIEQECFEALSRFGNQKTDSGIFKYCLSYKNYNYWYYNKFRLYLDFKNFKIKLKLIEKIHTLHNNIKIYTSNSLIEEWTDAECVILPKQKKNRTNFICNYLPFFILRSVIGSIQSIGNKYNSILVLDFPGNHQPMLFDGEHKKANYIYGYLHHKIKNCITLSEINVPKIGTKFLLNNWKFVIPKYRNEINIEWILLRYVLLNFRFKKLSKYVEKFKITLNQIPEDSLETKTLKKLLQSYMKSNKLYILRHLAFLNFLNRKKIIEFLYYNEYSPYIKALGDAAILASIKTTSIQHGAIYPTHPGYRFESNDTSRNLFPDNFLLWGEHWKNILIDLNHPIKTLKIIGQIRTDIIPEINQKDKRNTIVFASQPMPNENLRFQVTKDVFKTLALFPNWQLIIKPHPRETEDEYFNEIAKQEKCSNYIIERKKDLYLILAECSALITSYSTVGAESIYFRKTLIVLDYEQNDSQSYLKLGVGIKASNQVEFLKVMRTLDKNGLQIPDEKYDSFIKKFAYKIDGKVVERALQIIS